MCGVAGIFHYGDPARQVDKGLLTAMTRRLAHRGPDDEGFFSDGAVGLGHRRLTIVDLTPAGRQPMVLPEGPYAMSYNGEIYNHQQLRRTLEARGVRFRGTSDTETLLHGFAAEGPAALLPLAGIFAFAFWDGRRRRLSLARDPLGVKQLYYHDDGRSIFFASEIKALLECPHVSRELDPEALNQYLHFHTPLFERTFLKGIRQLRQGEVLEIDDRGIRAFRYWEVGSFDARPGPEADQIRALRELLRTVVGEQLMSDVPVGAFFSGGIDSSAVAAFARQSGRRLRLFGIHFSEQGVVDERPFQEVAAKALGLDLELTTLSGDSFPEDLLRLTCQQDGPVIGAALIPMYHVSQLAAARVKVCLGGQAADELFGGYARYALVAGVSSLTAMLRGSRDDAGSSREPRVRGNLFKQLFDRRNLRRLAGLARAGSDWRRRYFLNFIKVSPGSWRRIFPDVGCFSHERAWEQFVDTLERSPASEPLQKVLHWDVQTYLPGLFHQDDRMSMANGLESRVPLADPRVVRFAMQMPAKFKLRAGASKWVLRQAVAPELPEVVLNRRKVGFDTPAERWIRDKHLGFVRELLLSDRARARGFWDSASIARLLDRRDQPHWFDMVWKLLSVEAWALSVLDRGGLAADAERNAIHAAR